jgi:hypothetical protein
MVSSENLNFCCGFKNSKSEGRGDYMGTLKNPFRREKQKGHKKPWSRMNEIR